MVVGISQGSASRGVPPAPNVGTRIAGQEINKAWGSSDKQPLGVLLGAERGWRK